MHMHAKSTPARTRRHGIRADGARAGTAAIAPAAATSAARSSALLDERPMHGYEMIQELEERTGGRWRPSAGSIYPTLQLLEDEGLVSAEEVDGKRVFSLTDAGREAVEEGTRKRPGRTTTPTHPITACASGDAARRRGDAGRAGRERRAGDTAAEILTDARRKLYAILSED